MRVLEAVRRANLPGPPENSIRLRVSCLGAVLVSIAACASVDEVARLTAGVAVVLVSAGTVFSHRTRAAPAGVGEGRGGSRCHRSLRVVLPLPDVGRRHHDHRQSSGPPSDLGPRRPLVPCAVPARPALLACRVGRADGGGGGPGHRPRLRSLRRGLGLLRTLGPDRDVDVVERRWTDLRCRTGERAGGHVRRGRGDLRGPSRPGRGVEGVLPDPGRRRWIDRRPGGAGRRFRVAGSAVPRRQPEQPDPRRRLPRLRRQPQHRTAWEPGHHARDAGAGPAPLVLGRGDLRHVERPELDRSTGGLAPTSRVLTFRPPGPGWSRPRRPRRPADLLRRKRHREPRVPRGDCRRAVVPHLPGLLFRRRHHRLADRPGDRVHLHGRVTGERSERGPAPFRHQWAVASAGDAGGVRTAAASVPSRAVVGAVHHCRRHDDVRKSAVPDRLDREPHPLLP